MAEDTDIKEFFRETKNRMRKPHRYRCNCMYKRDNPRKNVYDMVVCYLPWERDVGEQF